MRTAFLSSAIAVACLALTGCLDFDEQEIRVRIDPAKDRLDALLVYRGIYRSDEERFLKASTQLDELAAGKRVFAFIVSWPLSFDQTKKEPAQEASRQVLNADIYVKNGRFYRASDGRLCGWQVLRVEKVSATLEALNAWWRSSSAASLERPSKENPNWFTATDAASADLMKRAIADKHEFFVLRGTALAYRMPMSIEGQKKVFLGTANNLRKPSADAVRQAELDRELALLATLELSWIRSGDVSELVIGNPKRAEQRIHLPRNGKYEDNLADLLAEKKMRVYDDVTDETILKEFETFCAH